MQNVVFDVVSDELQTRASAHLYLVVLHQLSSRAQLNDLTRLLKRITLNSMERLSIVLDVQPGCPRAVSKGAARLCARHAVHFHSVERPLAAVSHALAGIKLLADDIIVVMRDVYPDGDLVARLADAAATCSSMTLFTMAPAIAVGFAASAELLSVFCQDCPVLAAHHDSDVLLHCFAAGNDTSSVQSLASKTEGYITRPLRSYQPPVQQLDIETLERVLLRLSLHLRPQALPALQSMAAGARALLRRSVAANWRADVEEHQAVRDILFDYDLGVVLFCRRAESRSLECCMPAFMCELGVRQFSEELEVHSDGDVAFRNAMLKEFPQLKARIAELTRRAVTKLVCLDDNLCSARRQCE